MKHLSMTPTFQILFFLVAHIVTARVGEVPSDFSSSSSDHPYHDSAAPPRLYDELSCSEVKVTDTRSCARWCGHDLLPKWTPIKEQAHISIDDEYVNYLVGWTCQCSQDNDLPRDSKEEEEEDKNGDVTLSARVGTTSSEGGKEKRCKENYDFPTCTSVGIRGCDDWRFFFRNPCHHLCKKFPWKTVPVCDALDTKDSEYTMCPCVKEIDDIDEGIYVCSDVELIPSNGHLTMAGGVTA